MESKNRRLRGEGTTRELPNGKIEIRFWVTDHEGTRLRKSVTGETVEDATASRDDILARAGRNSPLVDSRDTVQAWYDSWSAGPLADSERRVATQDQYRTLLKSHALPRIGEAKLAEIRPSDIRSVLSRATTRAGKPLAGSSRRSLYAAMRALFSDAVTDQLLADNPVAAVTRPKSGRLVNRALAPGEVQELLTESREHRWHVIVVLAAMTGLRRGEILGLQWEDVDLENGELRVEGNLTRTSAGLIRGAPKSEAGYRTVPLPSPAVTVLRKVSSVNARNRLADPRFNRDGYVVTSRDGYPADPRTVSRWYTKLATKTGVRDKGLHALRHSAATEQLGSGRATELDVAKMLGHTDTRLLIDLYADAIKESQRAASDHAASRFTGTT